MKVVSDECRLHRIYLWLVPILNRFQKCAVEQQKMQKNGEVGDRNLDLPQSARCKADALPLSYIP
jgi:hypothetical protein